MSLLAMPARIERTAVRVVTVNFYDWAGRDKDPGDVRVVQWENGEGLDVTVSDSSGVRSLSLSLGAIAALTAALALEALPLKPPADEPS